MSFQISSLIEGYWRALQQTMKKYQLRFYIQSDPDATLDTMTVEAKNEDDACKQVRKNVIGRPKFTEIKEVQNNEEKTN